MTAVTSLPARVLDTIRRHGLLQGGETVLVAVSGGADSVALLDALRQTAPALRLALEIAHVHHGLRPEAEADADFVRGLCHRLGLPFHLERVSVRKEPPWEGLEAEARRARYAALSARALVIGAARVATGHTADDQAESVLMRLIEGAGPRGLAGIAPARGIFIRPLIDIRRHEILAHLESRGLGWVEDATNRDPRFLRNRIRRDVLPFLVEAVGPSIIESLCRSAALSRALVTALERHAKAELSRLGTRGPSGVLFKSAELLSLPEEVAAEVLALAAADLGETGRRRGAGQRALRRLLGTATPRRGVRMGRLCIERSGRWLRVGPAALPSLPTRRLRLPGVLDLGEVERRLEARCFERSPDYAVPREAHRVAFDADRLPPELMVRPRRSGDRFIPFGEDREHRLKSFLIDAGIPRWERPRIPLLEARGEIVWVAGLRRGQAAPVLPETKRILEVTLRSL